MALNIFEPRYRLMIRRCMTGSRRFGMALVTHQHELCDVACECEILECQPQPDGYAILLHLMKDDRPHLLFLPWKRNRCRSQQEVAAENRIPNSACRPDLTVHDCAICCMRHLVQGQRFCWPHEQGMAMQWIMAVPLLRTAFFFAFSSLICPF